MTALIEGYAGVVVDIDGVLVLHRDPVPGAGETLAELRRRGVGVQLATNNAARTPDEIAKGLADVGLQVSADEILTSALVAAELLAPGTACLVIGMSGLRTALQERGCRLVDAHDEAEAVVVGLDHDLRWDDLRRATLALHRGVRFIGTNADVTYPAPEGPWPGNGAALAALTAATGRTPQLAGKPEPAMFHAAAERLPAGPLLMVGDRPETDIAGAAAAGWDTALVLTGTTTAAEVAGVTPVPTFVLDDVTGLLAPPPRTTMPRQRIRTISAADVPAVLALWDQAGMLDYTPEPQHDLAAALAHDRELVLVAEVQSRVVGVLLGTSDGRRGWLQRLVVDPDHRRRGIARRLVSEVEDRLGRRAIAQANLLHFAGNRAGAAFWEALGYTETRPVAMRTKRLHVDPPARQESAHPVDEG